MTRFAQLVHTKHVQLGIRSANCEFCWYREPADKRPEWVRRMTENARVYYPRTGGKAA